MMNIGRRTPRTQIWLDNEQRPGPDLAFNPFPGSENVPEHWFEEHPEYAAELYVLERFKAKWYGIVHVMSPKGNLFSFTVSVSDPYMTRDIRLVSRR